MTMKILVTGGAGYIGSHTCKALALQGHEVVVYDNLSTGHKAFARWGSFEHGDIRETDKLRACLKKYRPEGIIHFAASANVGESVADPGQYYSNNVGGTVSILEAMRDTGIKNIVVSGSCAVYGQPETLPIAESCPTNPLSPYGTSKLFMERMLPDFQAAHAINWMSLRYFNAAGGSPDAEIGELHTPETHLIPRVIFAALGAIPSIDIFGDDYATKDGTCIRDYIHVNDLAEAHILAMGHLVRCRESMPINLGSGQGYSVLEIIEGVERSTGKKIPRNITPRRHGDPARLIADTAKAKEVLGWTAQAGLDTILRDAIRFLEKNKRGA